MVMRSRGIGRSGSSCRNCTSCSTVTKPQRTQVLMPGIGELAGAAFCSLPHAPQARNDNWPAAAPPAACWVFEASRNRCRSCMCSSQSAGVGCSSISSSRDTICARQPCAGWPTAAANGVLQAAGAAISLLTPKRSCQRRKQSTPVCTIMCTCVRRAHGCSRLSAAVCKSAHGNRSSFAVCVRAHSSREKRTRWGLDASSQK